MINSVTFSPDGLYIASASYDTTIRIWDATTDDQVTRPLEAHQDTVVSVAVSNDDAFIASSSKDDTVRVWESQTGNPKLPPNKYNIYSQAISPDACFAASASMQGPVQLWDLRNGDSFGHLLPHQVGRAGHAILSPNSPSFGEPLRYQMAADPVVAFSPDARWLACGSNNWTVYIWDVSTQQPLSISPFRCNPAAEPMAVGDFESLSEVPAPRSRPSNESINSIAFSRDCRIIAAGDGGGNVYLWYTHTGQRAREPLHGAGNSRDKLFIAFSPSGLHIASSGADNIGHVWDIAAGERSFALVGHTGNITSIAYLPDGLRLVTGSRDYSVRLWDAETGGQLAVMYRHASVVGSIACTSNNQSIVTGSDDSIIRIWDVQTALALSSSKAVDPMMALELRGLHDGWVLGQSGELLLWVPEEYRTCLVSSICKLLIAEHRVTITTGDVWHQGDDWTSCWLAALPA